MSYKCLIIEDQLPAQRILQTYLEEIPELELIATCTSPVEAMQHLKNHNIYVIFLDIHLPKISGLNFLRSLKNPPHIVITTAFSEHALEGFELDVADYLLKPFSFERFFKAVTKVVQPTRLTGELSKEVAPDTFMYIKVDKAVQRIEFNDLHYLKSDGDYVWLMCDEKRYFLQQSLKYWQNALPGTQFIRIHKSYIVNLSSVLKIEGNEVIVKDARLPIGRMYRDMLNNQIGFFLK